MRNALLSGLLGLTAVLAALVIMELNSAGGSRSPGLGPAHRAAVEANQGIPAAANQRPAMVAAILARPVFEPSRRPPVIAVASVNAAEFPRLAGIVITADRRSAIFAASVNGRPLVLAEGERVGGYQIQSIGPDQIVVVDREGGHPLRPTFNRKLTEGAAATPTPGAQAGSRPATQGTPPKTVAGAFGRVTVPGLSGRPLGLAATPASTPTSAIPSIAERNPPPAEGEGAVAQ